MRKPKIKPKIDYHISINPDVELLVLVLKGHLVLDAMISMILQHYGYKEEIWKWSFPKKIAECLKVSPMQPWLADICIDINNIRNDYCHSLGHEIMFDEAFVLVNKWSKLGLDYSDEGIYQDKNYSSECYCVDGIIEETLSNTMVEINDVFEKIGLESTY